MRCVLNVGGNSKAIPIPEYYKGWRHDLLDIDPNTSADIICDGRNLVSLKAESYDSVYCSHNLEHYHPHETYQVLMGFKHILKPDGFADIRVPDIGAVMKFAVENKLDINDPLYHISSGPIHIHDVIYGWGREIERSGNSFFAHKTGFSPKSLKTLIERCGFYGHLMMENPQGFEIKTFIFKGKPSEELQNMLDFKL